jgi:hypothetical protein
MVKGTFNKTTILTTRSILAHENDKASIVKVGT